MPHRRFLKTTRCYIWKERLRSKTSSQLPQNFQPLYMEGTISKQILNRSFVRTSDLIHGRNDYQAELHRSFLKTSRPYMWQERLPSKASIATSSELLNPIYGIWKERLPSKPHRSFLRTSDIIYSRNDYQARAHRSFLEAFSPYTWKEQLPSKAPVVASSELSAPVYGRNDYQTSLIAASSYIDMVLEKGGIVFWGDPGGPNCL
jgi:hypothetical protein